MTSLKHYFAPFAQKSENSLGFQKSYLNYTIRSVDIKIDKKKSKSIC